MIQPKLIIHGGAGNSLANKGGVEAIRRSLTKIISEVYTLLQNGASAVDAVVLGCQLLEDDPRFNAGTGSVLQSDGQIRMSASLMDGFNQSFSGVINVSRVKNPIFLAQELQKSADRVLSDYGSGELARELQLPIYNPLTNQRLNEWLQDRQDNFKRKSASILAEDPIEIVKPYGTIGVVALDTEGRIAAGTSTGGKGFERIGRVSDSAMPAGNYSTGSAGVSCTGIGEDIINECLAARIVIRVTDGFSLKNALERSFTEASEHGRDFGAIALDANGVIGWGKTCDYLVTAFHNGQQIGDALDMGPGTQVFTLE